MIMYLKNSISTRRTIKENVEYVLLHWPIARDNDKALQALYWEHIDRLNFKYFHQEFMSKATSPDSITRARRLIQEEGRFLPSIEVANSRRLKRAMVASTISKTREIY